MSISESTSFFISKNRGTSATHQILAKAFKAMLSLTITTHCLEFYCNNMQAFSSRTSKHFEKKTKMQGKEYIVENLKRFIDRLCNNAETLFNCLQFSYCN